MASGRVLVAFDDNWDVESPTWTRLDEQTGYEVQQFSIDRSRESEFDKTGTGEATVQIIDYSGAFDPTYSSGTFFGKMDPMRQVMLQRYDPIAGTWYSRFRGFVSRWTYQLLPKENALLVTIECKDGLGVLATAELMTGQHGDPAPAVSTGNIWYGPTAGTIVQSRINSVLDDAGWPSGLRSVFSGNVDVQPTVYSARNQFLTAIDDASDAEFPGVANRYIDRIGNFTFHGRLARFHPTDVQYDIATWSAGDDAAAAADANTVPIAGGDQDTQLTFVHDENDIINQAYFAPKDIAQSDIENQWFDDSTSISQFGPKTLSGEDLLTQFGYLLSNDANDETLSYGQYFVDNYKDTVTRVPQISFATRDTGDDRAAKLWDLLGKIDISDRVVLTTTHHWGGGFAGTFFVEGCHETQTPMNTRTDEVRMTVDLSPAAFFDHNEWE